jgi:catechol 2,3-dioxygenase-like lactoylglutathione lyase family enzyme
MAMIKAKGIYHLGIPVDDMDRAIKFYTEVLGMVVTKQGTDDMGGRLSRAELRAGNDIVDLFLRPQPRERDALQENGATHQAFAVSPEDFDLAVEKMTAWGVKVHATPHVSRRTGRGFYFFDSEGNLLQLYAPPKADDNQA